MSGDLGGFDANDPENMASTCLPKGDYLGCVTGAEVKMNKDGKTKVLHLKFQVLDPEFKNRVVFQQLAFQTTNTDPGKQDWVRIGKGILSSLCRSINIVSPNDSKELLNKPCIACVKVGKASEDYDAQNQITKFKPRTTTVGQLPLQPPATVPQVPVNSENSNTPSPW